DFRIDIWDPLLAMKQKITVHKNSCFEILSAVLVITLDQKKSAETIETGILTTIRFETDDYSMKSSVALISFYDKFRSLHL
ncbi:MAG: hypothetical protein ACJ707_09985, partial [Nitrososphaera sp.]